MTIYESPKLYIQSATSLLDRVNRIDILINALYDLQLSSIGKSNIEEYQLDTGQSKTKVRYRSMKTLTDDIHALEKQKQMYLNQLNGSMFNLKDKNSLR